MFAVGKCGRQFDFTLEPGTLIRPMTDHITNGAYRVEVYAGKYEGLRGNIPGVFCAPDIMELTAF